MAAWPQPPPLPAAESGYLECRTPSPRLGGGRKAWVRECGVVGRLGGETRNLGGGKQVSFLSAPELQAHVEKICQLLLFVLKQREGGGAFFFFFFGLKLYVKCIPTVAVVLGGDRGLWQPCPRGADQKGHCISRGYRGCLYKGCIMEHAPGSCRARP